MTVPLPPLSATLSLLALLAVASAKQPGPGLRVARIESAPADGLGPSSAGLGGDDWGRGASIEWGAPPYATEFRAGWNDAGLWIRFDAADPSPWHRYTERDDPLWEEEVVEIFIDPDGDGRNYVEIEISPANVVCDLLMERGDPDKLGHIEWDFAGLQTRVLPWTDGREGWTVTAFLPWAGFESLPDTEVALPPRPGDRWHFNVFRIKRPHGPAEPDRDVILMAWSPVPAGSFHVPEVFREMEFEG